MSYTGGNLKGSGDIYEIIILCSFSFKLGLIEFNCYTTSTRNTTKQK